MKTFIFITKKGNSGARQNYRNLKLTSHLAVQDTMAAWREGCLLYGRTEHDEGHFPDANIPKLTYHPPAPW